MTHLQWPSGRRCVAQVVSSAGWRRGNLWSRHVPLEQEAEEPPGRKVGGPVGRTADPSGYHTQTDKTTQTSQTGGNLALLSFFRASHGFCVTWWASW